ERPSEYRSDSDWAKRERVGSERCLVLRTADAERDINRSQRASHGRRRAVVHRALTLANRRVGVSKTKKSRGLIFFAQPTACRFARMRKQKLAACWSLAFVWSARIGPSRVR